LKPDMIDAAAHHQAEGLKAGLLHEQELVDREVAREEMVLPHPREALAGMLREIVELARIEVRGLRLGHGVPPPTRAGALSSGAPAKPTPGPTMAILVLSLGWSRSSMVAPGMTSALRFAGIMAELRTSNGG
jgi:hypothetical protein